MFNIFQHIFICDLSKKKDLFLYLREREHEQGEGVKREGVADSLLSMDHNAELDPRTQSS